MTTSKRTVIAAVLLTLVVAFTLSSQRSDTVLFWFIFVAVGLGSTVVMGVAIRAWRPAPAWPWWCMTGALLCWAAGFAAGAVLGPDAPVATAGYVLGYLAFGVALYRFAGSGARLGADTALETGVVLLVAVYAAVELLADPVWTIGTTSASDRFSATVFPILDAVVLALLAQLLLSRRRPYVAVLLLALGAGAIATADVLYALDLQPGLGVSPRLLTFGWVVGYVLLAISALQPSMVRLVVQAPHEREPSPLRLAVSGSAVLVLTLVAVVAHAIDGEPETHLLLPAAAAVAGLTVWRVQRLVGQERQARRAAERSERYFQALAEKATDVYAVCDAGGRLRDISPAVSSLLGWRREDLVGKLGFDFVEPADVPAVLALLETVVARPGASEEIEFRARRADGSHTWVAFRLTNVLRDPAVQGLVANLQDIDSRKRLELELTEQAFHDALTGLANRALLQDRLRHALTRAARDRREVALLFCDLDGFKTVNDSLGHGAGDELLKVVAGRLQLSARASDTVARLGGDEFAILIDGGPDVLVAAHEVASRALDALREPVELARRQVSVSGSIGVAVSSAGCTSRRMSCSRELLRNADTAMYAAKAQGRNRWMDFDPSMHQAAETRLVLEGDLRGVVGRGELVVHYQPVVAVDGGALTGFEALVRWQHPTLGLVPPLSFIPLAEESGQIVEIGRWVLQQACRAAVAWPVPPGAVPLDLAVNVSARQLVDDRVVDDVAQALLDSGFPAARLVLELTESTLIAQPDEVRDRLHRLKALGVRIAIDDFGTGYSSLSYLRQFPVDILKIDRSFVSSIEDAGKVPPIVRALFDLGRTLELKTVAEGIESPEQLAALAHEGCDLGQGFLFARPMDEAAAAELVKEAPVPVPRTGSEDLLVAGPRA